MKVFLYFIYFFVAFFVVDSLIIFAVFMTPLLFVLKQDKNKK
ncbi:MAG: hypothetical protein E6976_09030 [Staphylococcus epidermidis]|nr:hypothetical protein [Staphylococcus epidermidis]